MKRILLVLLSLSMLVCVFSSCEKVDPSQSSENVSDEDSAVESSEEESSEAEIAEQEIEGTWRVIADVSDAVGMRWDSVCKEIPFPKSEMLLPVIVTIDASTIKVSVDGLDREIRSRCTEHAASCITARWSGKTGDLTMEEFLKASGITPEAILETYILRADFDHLSFSYTREGENLSVENDGTFVCESDGEKLTVTAEGALSEDMKFVSALLPLTFSSVKIEEQQVGNKKITRYYWDGDRDITGVTRTSDREEWTHRIGDFVAEERVFEYKQNGFLEYYTTITFQEDGMYRWVRTTEYMQSSTGIIKNFYSSYYDRKDNVKWSASVVYEHSVGTYSIVLFNAQKGGQFGYNEFLEYDNPLKRGVRSEAGFYSNNGEKADIIFYDSDDQPIGSLFRDGDYERETMQRNGTVFTLETFDGNYYTINDAKDELVVRIKGIEKGGEILMRPMIYGEKYQNDPDEVHEIMKLFWDESSNSDI